MAGIIPANKDDRSSTLSTLHTIGALGSGLAWLICALTLWWQLKKNALWKNVAKLTLLLPFVMIFAVSFVPEYYPGIAQRMLFAAYFIYILVLAIKLMASKDQIRIRN